MKKNNLSAKQNEILIFIKKFMAENKFSPSVREICKGVGLNSPATVHVHLKNLIEKGYLEKKREEPFHDFDYESGIDYGNSLKIWVTTITDKGINKLKELNLYRKKWYEEYEERKEIK